MKLGNRIKKLRELKGLSQADLAVKCGMSKGYLSMIEADKSNPTTLIMKQLLENLDARLEIVGPDDTEIRIKRCGECMFFAVDDHGPYASGYAFCRLWLKISHEYPELFPDNGLVMGDSIPEGCPLKLVKFVVGEK